MSDLISREDAIDELHHLIPYKKYHRGEWVYLLQKKEVFNALNSLPSADAVQGEWIDRSNGGRIKYPWWESCECNQCGGYGSGAYNFCPNCGADMRGDTE